MRFIYTESKAWHLTYILKYKHMDIQIKMHTNDEDHTKEVMTRLVETNMSTKLDNYLNKFDKDDAEGTIDVTVDKNKRGAFAPLSIGGKTKPINQPTYTFSIKEPLTVPPLHNMYRTVWFSK